jgi:hypothetical protein
VDGDGVTRAPLLVCAVACAAAVGCDAPARAQGSGSAASAVATPDAPDVATPDAATPDVTTPDLTTTAPFALPPGWRPQPPLAEAGMTAASRGAGGRAIAVEAWGDPGLGCFVTLVAVTGTRGEKVATIAAELETTLAAGFQVADWSVIDGQVAELSGRIVGTDRRGAVRGHVVVSPAGVPRAVVAACFYNEREPVRCDAACTALLTSLEAPRVTP